MKNISRRQLLGGLAALVSSKVALGAACQITPRDQEGPFYPQGDLNRDWDLTRWKDGKRAKSPFYLYVRGTVTDADCKPLAGADVEIWQADYGGKYNHTGDTQPKIPDPNFQFWGRYKTQADGKYEFITVIPGLYGTRPPHIHFKARKNGYIGLTTQMYFDPQTFDDAAFAEETEERNKAEGVDRRLIVLFKPGTDEEKSKAGTFDITLRKT